MATLSASSVLRDVDDRFDRYEHMPITPLDVLIFRIMEALRHGRVVHKGSGKSWITYKPWNTYDASMPWELVSVSHDPQLLGDVHVLRKLLFTLWGHDGVEDNGLPHQPLEDRRLQPSLEVFDLVQRYYLEADDPAFRLWRQGLWPDISAVPFFPRPLQLKKEPTNAANLLCQENMVDGKHWGFSDWHHLEPIRKAVEAANSKWQLHDGGAALPTVNQVMGRGYLHSTVGERWLDDIGRPLYPLDPLLHTATWVRAASSHFYLRPAYEARSRFAHATGQTDALRLNITAPPGRGRTLQRHRRPRTSESEPDVARFGIARLPRHRSLDKVFPSSLQEIAFPKLTPLQLFSRTRSRSLSQTRLGEMFLTPRYLGPLRAHDRHEALPYHPPEDFLPWEPACENCCDRRHRSRKCHIRCGHCGAPNPLVLDTISATSLAYRANIAGWHRQPHIATHCPVAKRNHCKCVPFPTLHTADKCTVLCSRECGDPTPRGYGRHKNAMGCKFRCCMCGIKGHSGKECRMKTCRCGGNHLGQDCTWNPTCRIPGCGRYLCGLHCRDCGSMEKPFDEKWRCLKCQGGGEGAVEHQQP